jgi:two-component system, chemotaxis family, sensor kinase CheA
MSDRNRDFVVESRDHLTTFEQSLLALEKAQSQNEVRNHIDRGLRAIHSLKGDAGFLGFGTLRAVSHAMESLLENFRDAHEAPPISVVEALLAARDRLAALVDDLQHSSVANVGDILTRLSSIEKPVSAMDVDIDVTAQGDRACGRLAAFFTRLAALGTFDSQRLIAASDLARALPTGPVRLLARLSPTAADEIVQRVLAGATAADTQQDRGQVYPLQVDLEAWARSTAMPLVTLLADLAKAGRLVDPQLDIGPLDLTVGPPAGPVVLRGEFHSSSSLNQLQESLRLPAGGISERPAVAAELPAELEGTPEHHPVPLGRALPTPSAAPTKQRIPAASPESERLSALRINVELLDRLMTLVSELTLVRNQSLLAFVHEEGTPRTIIQRLNAVTSDLQDTVLRTRMQPVGNLFGKFPRMVRDLARQLGKQVEVITVGREVELDKTVLEQLSDPLTHLIRNSIDHGIEPPEDRVAKGKAPIGQVTLSATPADGQVLIEIRDDGRGLDPAAIKAKALALRLKSQDELERLSPKELFSLVLLPGFSTAKQVTDVSGRGVGMDVVKTNVDQLEGSLTIDSTPGLGTSMLLRVPLTMAIIPCLIVHLGNERYAVPQRELEEIVCLHPGGKGAIEHAYDSEVFRLRDRLLPIVRFREVLERPEPFTQETKAELLRKYNPANRDRNRIEYIVVLRSRGKRFGLLVDEVRGTQEVVVKPMHTAMKRLSVFSGATLMGDGRVALIANIEGIFEHARCFGAAARTATPATRDPAEIHRILIFEYGPREQFALPLVQIRRIEMIDVNRIEQVGDQEFVTLDGLAIRIIRLDRILNVTACPQQPTMYLVLPKFVPEPMGILISRIVDTDSLVIDLQRATIADPGILGTGMVRGRLSLFLDIQFVREKVFGKPASAAAGGLPITPSGERRVLLIDDTPFFREIVKRYLEGAGVTVTTAVDGQDGLNKLANGQFDVIVCDIEMPNLDGWGFARAARERGCRLPLLALTSLSKAEHESYARSCGFDEFQEKLDHDRLVRTISRMLDESRQPLAAGGRQ